MKSYTFKLFVPPQYPQKPFDAKKLNNLLGKSLIYCSRGRHAIYHALRSLNIRGKVVIPTYSCHTIKDSVIAAGLEYIPCDIDADDLNISFNDFKRICNTTGNNVECVIVPSLYGNPANLLEFEAYCKEKGIKMIDDGAQSFGAMLDGQYVSTFGNAGLIAFSPGKATPAPMGALLWSENDIDIKRTRHPLVHKLVYQNYMINRLGAYEEHSDIYKKLIQKAAFFSERLFNIQNDCCSAKELDILNGSIHALFNGLFDFREKYYERFCLRFSNQTIFSILKSKRGVSVSPKIAILTKDQTTQKKMSTFLKEKSIETYSGYPLIGNPEDTPIARRICKNIIELPIENNSSKMDYLFDCIENFVKNELE